MVRIWHSTHARLLPAACACCSDANPCKCLPVHHRSLIVCTTLSGRLEIKHGRAAMLGFLHVIALKAGVVMPGYLSTSADLKFSDVPVGCFASLEAVPTTGWLEITVLTGLPETGLASKAQTDNAEGGGRRHRPRLEMPSLVQTAQTIAASDSLRRAAIARALPRTRLSSALVFERAASSVNCML